MITSESSCFANLFALLSLASFSTKMLVLVDSPVEGPISAVLSPVPEYAIDPVAALSCLLMIMHCRRALRVRVA